MNQVLLAGKIISIREFPTVAYATILCRDGKHKDYLDLTVFNPRFFLDHCTVNTWIGVRGRLQKNKQRDYKPEIIVEQIFFLGDIPMKEDENYTTGYDNTENDTFVQIFSP